MRLNLMLAALLCFITWMSSVLATNGPVSSCCLKWSTTRVNCSNIVNYTIQPEGICSIRAIVFRTVKGKTICSNPNSKWAQRVMQKVDMKTKELLIKGPNEEGSASDITPAVSSTSENVQQKRVKNVKRHQKKRQRRRRKCF